MKFYDQENKRLLLFEKKATADFWDQHWQDNSIKTAKEARSYIVEKLTLRYLKKGSKVIDGGCGDGRNVIVLEKSGFESFGVDFAFKAIKHSQKIFPNLKLSCQDVCKTDFSDNFFDGYWSLGVIEHLWDGYGDIVKEAQRILKKDGYFFVSFPYLSLIRKLKIALKKYPVFQEKNKAMDFYEFIFDANQIKKEISQAGFNFIKIYPYDVCKGLKSEISIWRSFFQNTYSSKSFFARVIRGTMSVFFSWAFGHIAILVFQNNKKY